jgi:hypothetical protein
VVRENIRPALDLGRGRFNTVVAALVIAGAALVTSIPRATGGRQKGVANKRTREIADAAVREGLTPLEYMLAVLRDESAFDHGRRLGVIAAGSE